MKDFLTIKEAAEKWSVSERTVRNWIHDDKLPEAYQVGRSWIIPSSAIFPSGKRDLLSVLRSEMEKDAKGGIYHKIQIDMTYNSNHIEGSRLSEEMTRSIFETRSIGLDGGLVSTDDIIETANHFRCVKLVIENAGKKLSVPFMKTLHGTLKNGTKDSMQSWFAVGDWKREGNIVGGMETSAPEEVDHDMRSLLSSYESKKEKSLRDIIDFHVKFERIHPFQDGNGRIGRLIMVKECLRSGTVPFIITDRMKAFYYRGLSEWGHIDEYLMDTCLSAQDDMKASLDYFSISYKE